jgi:hypothetical protein
MLSKFFSYIIEGFAAACTVECGWQLNLLD